MLGKIGNREKILPGLPRETSPLANRFWFFCFRWSCCELWCTPQKNFFSRRLRRFTVTRSIFNILQWKFRKILFKSCIIIWLNKLTLSVSRKKFLKTCLFFTELTLHYPPPPPPPLNMSPMIGKTANLANGALPNALSVWHEYLKSLRLVPTINLGFVCNCTFSSYHLVSAFCFGLSTSLAHGGMPSFG